MNLNKLLNLILGNSLYKTIKDSELEYLLWITNIYLKIKNIPGHIAEIGVADGRNAVLFGRLIKMHNDQSVRQYIGFDTFSGFTSNDLERDNHLDKNRWKNNSKKKVLERCERNNVSELIEIFEGDAIDTVPKILKNHKGKKFQSGKAVFALLYIDCNAYLPAIKSMENFLPFMAPGGFIVVDEKLQGSETEAILNFAKRNKFKIHRLGSNQVPICIQI